MSKFYKISGIILGSIFLLLILVFIFLQLPFGQKTVKNQIEAFLQKKLQTEISIGKLKYELPNHFEIWDLYLADKKKDTLIFLEHLNLDIDAKRIGKNIIAVKDLSLNGLNANINRPLTDTDFNYQFIIDAFSSSDETPKKETKSTPYQFDIQKISLNKINLKYDDYAGGLLLNTHLEKIMTRPTLIDIETNNYALYDFLLDSAIIKLTMDSSRIVEPENTPPSNTNFQLAIDDIDLKKIDFSMLDKTDSMQLYSRVTQIKTVLKRFDLLKQEIETGNFKLEELDGAFVMSKFESTEEETPEEPGSTNNWQIWSDGLNLSQSNFKIDDPKEKRDTSGMDYSHLSFRQIHLNTNNVYYSTDSIFADLKHLALKEQSGLNISSLRTQAYYTDKGAILKNFYLETPGSRLQNHLAISYPSLQAFTNNMGSAQLDINIKESQVGINDLLLFIPTKHQKEFLPYKNKSFDLIAKAHGPYDKLTVQHFYLAGLDGTIIDLNGEVNGLSNPDNLAYNLDVKEIKSTKKDYESFLPDSLKEQFSLPEWLSLNGKINGGILDYYPNLNVQTSDGDLTLNGELLMSDGEGKEVYNLDIKTDKFNLGKIMKQDSLMGRISTTIHTQGTGFDLKTMDNKSQISLSSFNLLGYDYQKIILKGDLSNNQLNLAGQSLDPNMSFLLGSTLNMEGKYPAGNVYLELSNANLLATKLLKDTVSVAGTIQADFESINPDYPIGMVTWEKALVNYKGKKLRPDSIYIRSTPDEQLNQNIEINLANIVKGFASGKMPLSKIGQVFSNKINHYYTLNDSLQQEDFSDYNFKVDGGIYHQPVLTQLLPDLKPFKESPFHLDINRDSLSFSFLSPFIQYGENKLDSLTLFVREEDQRIRYGASLTKAETPLTAIWSPSVRGSLKNDSIYVVTNINDENKEKQFTIGGAYYKENTGNNFTLFKGLRFDYNIWSVNPTNKIHFTEEGFFVEGLNISHKEQLLSIHSEENKPKSPLKVNIKNFNIGDITKMFSKDTLIAEGILNANSNIYFVDSFTRMDGNVFIDSLKAFGHPLGNLVAKTKTTNENTLNAYLTIDGFQNHLQLHGNYFYKPVNNNNFDFNLLLKPLSLKSVEGFTFGAIKNSKGQIRGDLAIKGTIDQPRIFGELITNDVATTVSTLNAQFGLPSESINFKGDLIQFNNFKIEDKQQNFATINGQVKTDNYKDYLLNLKLNAKEWQVLNSKKKDNPEYYGNLIISSNLSVDGPATAPIIDGNIIIHDSTDLNFALLDDGPGFVEHDGVVQFIDSRVETEKQEDTVLATRKRLHFSPSAQLNVNIDVKKEATFTLIVDPLSGDELQVKGEAALNTFMQPSGTIGLTGIFEVDDGHYDLHYNFLHRKFDIQKGSIIKLSGDPMEAEAEITATYNTDAAPYELVEDAANPDQLAYYKQRLPFQILLKINGPVMKPDIAFDIAMQEGKSNIASSDISGLIQAKLTEVRNNPSELNKQIFALLIMNRFLPNNPFSSDNSVNFEYAARKSVSRFLSDQLNLIAGQLVQGLELNFDLNSAEDYSTGSKVNQTNLNITASKSLFNERLRITIGNDFQLEGQSVPKEQSSLIPGNLAISYLLSKDGKYQVNAYRTNELQDIINGYIVETGLKFKASLSYDKFKNLFISKKKQYQRIQRSRQAQAGNFNRSNAKNDDKKG